MDPTLETMEAPAEAPRQSMPWGKVAWFGGLLILLYLPVLAGMVKDWIDDESMGHGFFVPLIAGYLVWQDRERLMAAPIRPSWFGYALIGWGFFQLLVGTLGAEFFIMRTSLLFSIVGLLLVLCGWPVVRLLAFPLLLLPFMIRIPLFIYSQITFPLQLFASRVAEAVLNLLEIPVLREGNVLELANQKLSVVEACSGIRSLLSLTFLSLVYGYFFEKRNWMRVVLFLSTIPIAIAANAARVSLTGMISHYKQEFAEGIYHTMEGWVIFMVALVALLMLHQFLNLIARTVRPQHASTT